MIALGLSGRNLTVKALPGPEFSSSRSKILTIPGRIPVYKNGEFLWWEFDKERLPKILETWGEKIHYSDSAKQYCESIKFKSLPLKDLPRAEITVHPIGKKYRDFQEFIVGLTHEKKGLLIFFDCGIGKTLTSLGRSFNTGAEKLLIITPKNPIREFKKELKESFGMGCLIYRDKSPKKRVKLREQFPDAKVIISNYEMLKEVIDNTEDITFTHVIFDECSVLGNIDNVAYKQAKRLKKKGGENYRPLLCSATPFENDIAHLWSYLNYVNPDVAGNREDFLNKFREPIRWTTITKERRDGTTFQFEKPIKWKTKNEKELKKLLDTCMVVVEADKYKSFEDYMEVIPVELTPKQLKFYDRVINELLEEAKNPEFWSGNPLHKTLVISQAAEGLYHFDPDSKESGKMDWVREDIRRRLEIEGSKSLYWSAFRKGIELLEKEYYGQCVGFHGDKSDNYRICAKYAFNGCSTDEERAEYAELRKKVHYFKDIEPGSIQLMFATYTLNSGSGMNLQNCDYQCFMSYDNKARSVKQARDRIRRINSPHQYIFTKFLIGDETDEDDILKLIFRKLEQQGKLLAGDGSAESVKAQEIISILKRRRKS